VPRHQLRGEGIALSGGGAGETLDVNHQAIEIDTSRCFVLFERLVDITPDGKLFNNLAEEFSPNNDATVWKIKIRSDVLFHNGKPFTADDVVYTFRYILDPSTMVRISTNSRSLPSMMLEHASTLWWLARLTRSPD
jgi:peptide/nickel transport system substrate-binding protein